MSDSVSDADKVGLAQLSHVLTVADRKQIRNKRLAKLGNQSQSQESSSESDAPASATPKQPTSPSAPETTAPKPKINITRAQPPSQSPAPNPFSQLGLKPTSENGVSSPNRPASIPPLSLKRNRPSESSSTTASESFEKWEDRTLSSIFRITLEARSSTSSTHLRGGSSARAGGTTGALGAECEWVGAGYSGGSVKLQWEGNAFRIHVRMLEADIETIPNTQGGSR